MTPDVGLFRSINGWPESLSPFLTFFSIAMNLPWVKVILGMLLIGLFATNPRTRRTAVQTLCAVGLANGLTDLFKAFVPMHRPYQELISVINRVGTSPSHGTASAHSANMAAVAFIFVYHLKWWGTPWVVIALLTGLSRVYVGAHYPYQVCLGYTCGIVAALCVAKTWDLIVAKRSTVLVSDVPDEST